MTKKHKTKKYFRERNKRNYAYSVSSYNNRPFDIGWNINIHVKSEITVFYRKQQMQKKKQKGKVL